ncbi:MAG: ribosome biogenesis GTP-binding protein YihA/YsxC [Bacilli bacterium]|nr:ribosome biogenesis GTP-binding protein YihA/YsxC [Bacilli bacterium]
MFETCEYVISAVNKSQYPNKDYLPEFVFLGRSNVGKSSLINALTKRKMLAKTSSKPGKTRTMNFFLIDKMFYLIDAPGYGYASRTYGERQDYGKYIEECLFENENLKVTFLLIDTLVGPTNDDLLMYEFLKYHNINTVIICTKTDKVRVTKLHERKKNVCEKLNCNSNDIIYTSSDKKTGFEKIEEIIKKYL